MPNQINQIDSVSLNITRNDVGIKNTETNSGGILRKNSQKYCNSNDILATSSNEIKSNRPKSKNLNKYGTLISN